MPRNYTKILIFLQFYLHDDFEFNDYSSLHRIADGLAYYDELDWLEEEDTTLILRPSHLKIIARLELVVIVIHLRFLLLHIYPERT